MPAQRAVDPWSRGVDPCFFLAVQIYGSFPIYSVGLCVRLQPRCIPHFNGSLCAAYHRGVLLPSMFFCVLVFRIMKMGLFTASCPAGLGECTLRPGGVAHSGFKAYQMLYLNHITMQKLGFISTMQLWSVGGDDFLNVVLSWSISSQAVI